MGHRDWSRWLGYIEGETTSDDFATRPRHCAARLHDCGCSAAGAKRVPFVTFDVRPGAFDCRFRYRPMLSVPSLRKRRYRFGLCDSRLASSHPSLASLEAFLSCLPAFAAASFVSWANSCAAFPASRATDFDSSLTSRPASRVSRPASRAFEFTCC